MKITIYNPDYIDSDTDRIRFWNVEVSGWIKKISTHSGWEGLHECIVYTSDNHGVDRDGKTV